jgi:hypothetical protein
MTQPGYYDPNQPPQGYGQPAPQGYQAPPPQYGPPPQNYTQAGPGQPPAYYPAPPGQYGTPPQTAYGYAPAPAPTAPPLATGTLDDFYSQPNQGGGPALSWSAAKGIGDGYRFVGVVARKITQGDVKQDTDPKTKMPKFHPDGRPKFSLQVPLRLLVADRQAPDGEARLFVRGQLRDELTRAMTAAGLEENSAPEEGALIITTLVYRKPSDSIAQNIFAVEYFRPGTWDPAQFAGQQAPVQQYPQQGQYQQVPAPQYQAAPQNTYPQAQQGQYAPPIAPNNPPPYQQPNQAPVQYAPQPQAQGQTAPPPQGQVNPQAAGPVQNPQAPAAQPPAQPAGQPQAPEGFSPEQGALLNQLLAQQAAGAAQQNPAQG